MLVRVNLVGQLLISLLSRIVITLIAQHLQDLFLGDFHDFSFVLEV